MNCRRLATSDSRHIFDFFVNNKKMDIRKAPSMSHDFIRNMEKNHEQIIVLGCFIEEELVGIVSAFRWIKLPYYTVTDLKTNNSSGSFKLYIQIFDMLLNNLTSLFESEGRYDFYFVNRQRNFHKLKSNNNFQQKSIPHFFTKIKQYEIYVQEIISPGNKSNYEAFNIILGNKTHNVTMWIRKASLKAEFRNKLITDLKVLE